MWSTMDTTLTLPELPACQQPVWARFETALAARKPPEALLFIGTTLAYPAEFARRLIAGFFCKAATRPCGMCVACCQIASSEHAHVMEITPETPGGMIAVDTVRDLQTAIYRTPQGAPFRFILVPDADLLNLPAANAMLKILEEPPAHTRFILVARSVARILPTILSRCQKWTLPSRELESADGSYAILLEASAYPADSAERKWLEALPAHADALCAICESAQSPVALARQWGEGSLDSPIRFLYLLAGAILRYQLTNAPLPSAGQESIRRLAKSRPPGHWLGMIRTLEQLKKARNSGITLNAVAALESLLLPLAATDTA